MGAQPVGKWSYQTVALCLPLSRNNMGRTLAFLLLCCAAVAWSAHFEDNPSESSDAWIETQSIPKAIPKEAKALVDALLEAQAKALLEAQGNILTEEQENQIAVARQNLERKMAENSAPGRIYKWSPGDQAMLEATALVEAQAQGDILTTAQEQEIKAARQKLTDTMAAPPNKFVWAPRPLKAAEPAVEGRLIRGLPGQADSAV